MANQDPWQRAADAARDAVLAAMRRGLTSRQAADSAASAVIWLRPEPRPTTTEAVLALRALGVLAGGRWEHSEGTLVVTLSGQAHDQVVRLLREIRREPPTERERGNEALKQAHVSAVREAAERAYGQDPETWPAWTCRCGQRHSGWALECGRCERARPAPSPPPARRALGYGLATPKNACPFASGMLCPDPIACADEGCGRVRAQRPRPNVSPPVMPTTEM